MKRETLAAMIEGIRKLLPTVDLTINRWLNTFEVGVMDVGMRGPHIYTFKDHAVESSSCLIGQMVDLFHSLPADQQLPWWPFMSALIERERRNVKIHEQLASTLGDLKLDIIALRHDAEASKRERDWLINKYENKS